MVKVSGIYIIVNTKNGAIYIGQSQDINKRWKTHKRELHAGIHKNSYLQRSWNKYSEKLFSFKILEYCQVENLNDREQHYINVYMGKITCYNLVKDVQSPMRGRKHTQSTLIKMRLTASKKSQEIRKRTSETLMGHVVSEETRRKISDAKKGKPPHNKGSRLSDEQKRHLSQINKGKTAHNKGKSPSEESRRKMSESHKGKVLSEEHKRKIGEASRNITDETRRKLSEATTRRHERERAERLEREKIDNE